MSEHKNYRFIFGIITLLFFFLGLITVFVDSLIPRLRELFELSYFQAGSVQFAFFSAYFAVSVPSSYFIVRYGYKKGILGGLLIMATGCFLFFPAAQFRSFAFFISGYFTVAAGMTLLQVAINPFVALLGDESKASSRLTLAQAFNSLGTAIAPILGAYFILSDRIRTEVEINLMGEVEKTSYLNAESWAVQQPFLVLGGVLVLASLLFIPVKLPKVISLSTESSYWDVLKHKNLLLGVIGIFCYVGAEVAIGSYLVNYFLDMKLVAAIRESGFMRSIAQSILGNDLSTYDAKAIVGVFVTFYWSGAMVGRFIGAYLNKIFSPGGVVAVFGLIAICLALISMNTSGFVAMWSIIGIGFFNSIMFPTIFTLALRGLGEHTPKASGLLCMAIVGGAIVPPFFGLVADLAGFKAALVTVICCYAYIAFFGRRNINDLQD